MPTLGKVEVARQTPEYCMFIGECIAALKLSNLLSVNSFGNLTNKMIYNDLRDFPIPVIATILVDRYKLTWGRLALLRNVISLHAPARILPYFVTSLIF